MTRSAKTTPGSTEPTPARIMHLVVLLALDGRQDLVEGGKGLHVDGSHLAHQLANLGGQRIDLRSTGVRRSCMVLKTPLPSPEYRQSSHGPPELNELTLAQPLCQAPR